MKWKFWRNSPTHPSDSTGHTSAKLSRPRDLPQQIGQHLVLRERMDPDWVWSLKCVLRPHGQRKTSFDFRVFSLKHADAAGISVKDYDSLDPHPDQILFHGWFDKKNNAIELTSGASDKAA